MTTPEKLKEIHEISLVKDIEYDRATGQFTNYSGERLIIQALVSALECAIEALKEIRPLLRGNDRSGAALIKIEQIMTGERK